MAGSEVNWLVLRPIGQDSWSWISEIIEQFLKPGNTEQKVQNTSTGRRQLISLNKIRQFVQNLQIDSEPSANRSSKTQIAWGARDLGRWSTLRPVLTVGSPVLVVKMPGSLTLRGSPASFRSVSAALRLRSTSPPSHSVSIRQHFDPRTGRSTPEPASGRPNDPDPFNLRQARTFGAF